MQCFIYKSLKKDYLYLYIAHKDDFSKVPNELLISFGKLEFVMDLYITNDRKLAREDAGEIIQCLIDQGFFVQLPSLEDKRCLPPFLREDDN
jgi:uncharacterized protein YcgL (UPF0745 family)